jgi:hypothetical protein
MQPIWQYDAHVPFARPDIAGRTGTPRLLFGRSPLLMTRGYLLIANRCCGRHAHDLLHRDVDGQRQGRAGCPLPRTLLARGIAPEQAGWFERCWLPLKMGLAAVS